MADTISDVIVNLNVEQPSIPINLGVLAVFVKGAKEGVETFTSDDDLQTKYGSNVALSKISQGYFQQDDHSDNLQVITYVDDIAKAAGDYYSAGWEFATVANTQTPGADGKSAAPADDLPALANFLDAKNERFTVLGLPATEDTVNKLDQTLQPYEGLKRTIAFASGNDTESAAFGIGALVGAIGNETVGSVTWKFKTLAGVAPTTLNASQILKLHKAHVFTYVIKAGLQQTSEGFTLSGEFIDALHGDDWIKAELETELQKLLSSSKKVSYDAAGIAEIDATVTTVLTQATDNGIILMDDAQKKGQFEVTTVSRANTPAQDIQQRKYNGLSFSYTRAGAIHSVVVSGTINL